MHPADLLAAEGKLTYETILRLSLVVRFGLKRGARQKSATQHTMRHRQHKWKISCLFTLCLRSLQEVTQSERTLLQNLKP